MKSYSTYLFDWDGCLVDTVSLWMDSYEHAFKQSGIVISREEIVEMGIYNFERVAEFGVTNLDRFGNMMYEYFDKQLNRINFFPDSLAFLTALKQNKKKIGIVTSTSRTTFENQALVKKYRHLFDVTICWEDTPYGKPHPAPVLKALEILGSSPKESAFIGDAHTDIMAGQAAGVATIHIAHQKNRKNLIMRDFQHLSGYEVITHFFDLAI